MLVIVSLCCITSCKKNNTGTAPSPAEAKCAVKTETTGLAGNQKSFEYEFDAAGNPTLVKVLNPNGSTAATYEIGSQTVVRKSTFGGNTLQLITKYNVSDITRELPSLASVSIDDGDTLRVNYYTYYFFYNSKKQLVKVGEQTSTVIGDTEYDLNIYYNAQGNVSALQYEWTTGPNQVIAPITVTAYDDKPTPYAGVRGMPFLLINYQWDNYDPEPVLTALSKNNPLDYTTGSGASIFKREMVYQYNAEGFPIERKNTNRNANGEYTFYQTFTYTCK